MSLADLDTYYSGGHGTINGLLSELRALPVSERLPALREAVAAGDAAATKAGLDPNPAAGGLAALAVVAGGSSPPPADAGATLRQLAARRAEVEREAARLNVESRHAVRAAKDAGMEVTTIARLLGCSRQTAHRFLRETAPPVRRTR